MLPAHCVLELLDQPLGFACLRENRIEWVEKHGFVNTARIAPVAPCKTHAGNLQNFGRDRAQMPPVDRRRKAETRNVRPQFFPRLGAPGFHKVEGRVERRRFVEEPREKCRKRRKERPGSDVRAAHFEIAFQPYLRKNGGKVIGPVGERRLLARKLRELSLPKDRENRRRPRRDRCRRA